MPDKEGHPKLSEIEFSVILTALADPLRRQVVTELALSPDGTERTCASFGFEVGKATLSHHFRILREAGLIRQVDRGNSRAATLRKDDLNKLFPGLLELLKANKNEFGK